MNDFQVQIFRPTFYDKELENEFNRFWAIYNLVPLFVFESRATQISYNHSDALSVVTKQGSPSKEDISNGVNERFYRPKKNGAYHDDLLKYANYISIGQNNRFFNQSMFKTLDEPNSFQGFMNVIRRTNNFIETHLDLSDEDTQDKLWQIVYYAPQSHGIRIW